MVATPVFSAFLFAGSQRYLKDEEVASLKRSLGDGSPSGPDYKVFYAAETTGREILDYASSSSLFSAKKLIVVRDAEKLRQDDRALIAEHIKTAPKDQCLVLDTEDQSLINEFAHLAKLIRIMRFDELADHEVSSWIVRFVAARGKKIEGAAIQALKELQGRNLLALSRELEKLLVFIGERPSISPDDIETLVGRSVIASGFNLVDAVNLKDVKKAIDITSDLMLSGERPHEIIGLLSWQVNRILKLKIMQANGANPYSVASALGVNRRYQDKFLKQARSFTLDQAKSGINILLEADCDIKTSRLDSALALELALIRLCFL